MAMDLQPSTQQLDLLAWKKYKEQPTPANRSALLKRFNGVLHGQVNKWAGPVPSDVLMNQAKVLAVKGFDTYNPNKGASLSTHITNCLLPLSRTVYTYQNTARIPENLTIKINTYNQAVNEFKLLNGREPSTDELHDKLGWKASEITRMRDYNVKDLMESGAEVTSSFHDRNRLEDLDDGILDSIYMELDPDSKKIFEYTTGYNGAPILSIADICKRTGLTVSQVAYKKTLMRQTVDNFMKRPSVRRRFSK